MSLSFVLLLLAAPDASRFGVLPVPARSGIGSWAPPLSGMLAATLNAIFIIPVTF